MPDLMEAIQTYVAPECEYGDPVLFYQDGDRGQRPHVGFVVGVDGRAVDIVTLDRQGMTYRQEVHHLTDPLLKQNPNIKSYGGWELNPKFTTAANIYEVTQALQRRLDKVYEKLSLRDTEPRVEQMLVPETSEQPNAADVGLSNVVFAQPSGPEIEGGQVIKNVTVEEVLAHSGVGTPFRKEIMAAKLGVDLSKLTPLLTAENGFTKVQFGHYTYHPKQA